MTQVYNRFGEKSRRRELRCDMPRAEVILWSKLKGKQIAGCKFRRQYSIGSFVVDFYCVEAKLAVEVDGESHGGPEVEARDGRRQRFIESFGIRFLRPANDDVYHRLEGVLWAIEEALKERLPIKRSANERSTERCCSDPPLSPLVKGGLSKPLLDKEG